jgi:hypothetical protein
LALAVFSGDFRNYGDHWKPTVEIRIIVTVDSDNIYTIDEVLGHVLVAMNEVSLLDQCLKPIENIETNKFEWDHSHQQATADATYRIELRG